MHHLVSLPSRRRSLLLVLTAAYAIGCDRAGAGEIHVILDSSSVHEALEVMALPFDPSVIGITRPLEGESADSLRWFRALEDSAETAAARFRAERDSINAAVAALRRSDRTTPGYANAFATLEHRITSAEALRVRRDTLRHRSAELGTALGLSIGADGDPAGLSWQLADSAARAAGREILTAVAYGDTTFLRAPEGRWWIASGRSGEFVSRRSEQVDVRRGDRIQVRLTP